MSFEQYDNRALFDKGTIESIKELQKEYGGKHTSNEGLYGVTEKLRPDGLLEKMGFTPEGLRYKEYYQDGIILKRSESVGLGKTKFTYYDDNGSPYMSKVRMKDGNYSRSLEPELVPNNKIVKGAFSAETDPYGRTVSARLDEITIRPTNKNRESLNGIVRGKDYKPEHQKGHLMADSLGGPASFENIVPQLDKVNQGLFKKVENIVRDLKLQGENVSYEVKVNYAGAKSKVPTSFEPKIYIDGKEYSGLPQELKKIFNSETSSNLGKTIIGIKEKYGVAHELGKKSAIIAGGLTLAMSSVDNIASLMDGEISAEDMIENIIKDTSEATALGYGAVFISTKVAEVMANSSSQFLSRLGNSCLPASLVAFAVESYGSLHKFAMGEIDSSELAMNLGDNAIGVAGGVYGAKLGAAMGTLLGPAGTVVGTIVGGMIGCALSTELYKTAVEWGSKNAELLLTKVEELAGNTIKTVADTMPEKLDEVSLIFANYFVENDLKVTC